MADFGRILIFLGLSVAAIGGLVWMIAKSGFRGLPGDVAVEGESMRFYFYFPIVTCIVVSAILTGGMWLWRWISGR